jgi:hypothetical protein
MVIALVVWGFLVGLFCHIFWYMLGLFWWNDNSAGGLRISSRSLLSYLLIYIGLFWWNDKSIITSAVYVSYLLSLLSQVLYTSAVSIITSAVSIITSAVSIITSAVSIITSAVYVSYLLSHISILLNYDQTYFAQIQQLDCSTTTVRTKEGLLLVCLAFAWTTSAFGDVVKQYKYKVD